MTIPDFATRYAAWLATNASSSKNSLANNEIQMLIESAGLLTKKLTKGFPFSFITYMLSKKMGIVYHQPIASEQKMQAMLLGWQQAG